MDPGVFWVPVVTYIVGQSLVKKPGVGVKQTWVQIHTPSGRWGGGEGHPKSLTALRLVYLWDVGPGGVLFSKHFTSPNSH